MTLRSFVLVLVASQIPAFAASAVEHKRHHRDADRMMSAHSDTRFHTTAHPPSWAPAAPAPSDPPDSANGG